MGDKKTLLDAISKLFGKPKPEPQIITDLMVPGIECHSEEEFMQYMLFTIGGYKSKIAIIQQPDRHSPSELEDERKAVEAVGGVLKIPALITPTDRKRANFMPYIVIFTHDNKLFMHPYGSDAFSDIGDEWE